MISEYHIGNTAVEDIAADGASWSELATALFAMGPVAVLDGDVIFARVTGYCDDPTWGKIIRIQRVDEKGHPVFPDSETV